MVLGVPGRVVFAGLWLALTPVCVLSQEPPPGLVWYVLDELNHTGFDIEDPTNRPIPLSEPPAGVLLPVDFSRDGVVDWLIRWPEDQRLCGTGGCRLSLYVSDDNRYLRVFDRQAWDPDIRTVGDEIRLEASFHHLNCLPPREVCRLAWAWDPTTRSLSERPSSDGEAVVSGFGEGTVDLGEVDGRPKLPDDIPAAVFDRYLAGRRACGNPNDADAFTVSYPAVASTPDLNGDGQRDWVIEAPSFCAEQAAADYGYEVWISDETDGASRAFVAAPGRWPAFQVDRTPAGMLDARPCLTGEICETVPLEWNRAARVFTPASSESLSSRP